MLLKYVNNFNLNYVNNNLFTYKGVCVPRPSALDPYPRPSTLGPLALGPHLVGPGPQDGDNKNDIWKRY